MPSQSYQLSQQNLRQVEAAHLKKFEPVLGSAKPVDRVPVYSAATRKVAYYETKMSSNRQGDKGYLMVSATTGDLPVVEFSNTGKTQYEQFRALLGNQAFRMVRYNSHYMAAETPTGRLLAEIGERPVTLPPSHRKHMRGEGGTAAEPSRPPLRSRLASTRISETATPTTTLSYRALRNRAVHDAPRETTNRARLLANAWSAALGSSSAAPTPISGPHVLYTADGIHNRTSFRQFEIQMTLPGPGGRGPTVSWSIGCGPVAWMNLLGWHDLNFQPSLLSASHTSNDEYSENLIRQLYDYLGTFGFFGGGLTMPGDMPDGFLFAARYLGHDSHHWWRNDFNLIGNTDEPWVFRVARSAIRAKRPFIVGYEEDFHYAIGMEVAEPTDSPGAWKSDSWIHIDTCWDNPSEKWIPIDTIFAVYAPYDFYPIEQAKLPFGSYSSPTVTKKSNEVFMAIRGKKESKLNFYSSSDGLSYSRNVRLDRKTPYAPSLATFKNKQYVAWTGGGGKKRLQVMRSSDGTNWGDRVSLTWRSDAAPCLTVFKNHLYLVWFSVQGRLNVARSADGRRWPTHKKQAWYSHSSPAAVQFGGKLFVALRSRNEWLKILESSDGLNFSEAAKLRWRSRKGPGLCVHNNRLVIGWKGRGHDRVNLAFSRNGVEWDGLLRLATGCEDAPELLSFDGKLIVAVNLRGTEHRILVRKQPV